MTGTPAQIEAAVRMRAAKGRMPRQEAVKQQRRRRSASTLDRMMGMTLDIFSPEQLDPNYVYRWISDVGSRLSNATKRDDYDLVHPSEIKDFDSMDDSLLTESKDRIRTYLETGKQGQPVYGYFCRKPKEFFEEDQQARMQMRADLMEGRVFNGDGGFSSPAIETDGGKVAPVHERADNYYVPQGNRLGQVSRRKKA